MEEEWRAMGEDGWCVQIDLRGCFLRRGVAGHEDGGGGEDSGILHFEVGLVGGGFFVACGVLFSVAFLGGLMEEERGRWLSTGTYIARGSLARDVLAIPHRHIDLSAQSPVTTPSYFFGDYKDLEA